MLISQAVLISFHSLFFCSMAVISTILPAQLSIVFSQLFWCLFLLVYFSFQLLYCSSLFVIQFFKVLLNISYKFIFDLCLLYLLRSWITITLNSLLGRFPISTQLFWDFISFLLQKHVLCCMILSSFLQLQFPLFQVQCFSSPSFCCLLLGG